MPEDENHNARGPGFDPVAGLLAALLPGLGHLYRGEPRRALLAGGAVLAMFFGGLLIGGIDVVDREEDFWWFTGQSLVGPLAFGANALHQTAFKAYPIPDSGSPAQPRYVVPANVFEQIRRRSLFPSETREIVDVHIVDPRDRNTILETRQLPVARPAGEGQGPPATKSLAKVNEVGTLYVLVAGMLNLIVFLDALLPTRPRPPRPAPATD